MTSIKDLQEILFEEYKKNGYLNMWTKCSPKFYTEDQRLADLAEVGLFNTEVAETQEAIRNFGYPMILEKLGEELADIVIRVFNFASRKGIDMELNLLSKNEKNLSRGERHGKKI